MVQQQKATLQWGALAIVVLAGAWTMFHLMMNLNYLLAGTVSINPVLGMFGLFLCFSWRVCGWIGVDRWVLPALGLPWKPGTWFRPQATPAASPPSVALPYAAPPAKVLP